MPGRLAQRAALCLGADEAEGVFDDQEEPVGRERLLEEVDRAEARGADRGVDRRVPAHHDDRRVVAAAAEPLEQADAVAVGERDVEQHDVVAALAQPLLGDLDAAGDVDGVALERQRLLERGEDRGLVVDDEQVRPGHGEKT